MPNFYAIGSSNLDASPDTIQGPIFLTGPTITSLAHGIYSVTYSLDVIGDDTWTVAVTSGGTTPTVAQIAAGQNGLGNTAIGAGSDNYGGATDTFSFSGGTLVPGTTYDVYTAATNAAGGESTIHKTTLELYDDVAPSFVDAAGAALTPEVYASGTATTSTTGAVSFRFDEDCDYHVIAIPTGQAKPTAAEMFAGAVANSIGPSLKTYATSAAPAPEPNIGISGLSPSTVYDVWIAARDKSSNQNMVISDVAHVLTTTAGTASFNGTISDIPLSVGIFYTADYSTLFDGETSYATTLPSTNGMNFDTVSGVYSGTPTAEFALTGRTVSGVNSEGAVLSNTFDVTSTDVPASFTSLPSYSALTNTTATVSFTSDQAGDYYVSVVLASEDAPTDANIIAGDRFGGADADFASTSTMVADTNVDVSVTGLVASTGYRAWVLLDDGNSYTKSYVNFTTSAALDNTPPVLTSVSVSNRTNTQAQVNLESNEVGYFRIVLLPVVTSPFELPSAAQIFAGTGASDQAALFTSPKTFLSANIITPYTFTGLSPGTTYHTYIAIEDAAGNTDHEDTDPTIITTTGVVDSVAPDFASGPTVVSTSASIITTTMEVTETGFYRAVAVLTGSAAPTADEVLAGTASGGAAPSGSILLTGMNSIAKPWGAGIGGLASSTTYDIYIALQDEANNSRINPLVLTATTDAAAEAAPTYNGGFSISEGVVGQTISINVAAYFTGDNLVYTHELNNVVVTNGLPSGITLSSSGVLSGTYTAVQNITPLRIIATNSSGSIWTDPFVWSVVSPSGGAKFTGVLRSWETGAVYSNKIGVRMYVVETFGGTPINSTVATFDTNALGQFDVTITEAIAGTEYYVLKESPDGTITSLQKDTAEAL